MNAATLDRPFRARLWVGTGDPGLCLGLVSVAPLGLRDTDGVGDMLNIKAGRPVGAERYEAVRGFAFTCPCLRQAGAAGRPV